MDLAERHFDLLTQHIQDLREVINMVKHAHPFVLEAIVVLPEHLHAIWCLPQGDAQYPMRWGLIKAGFSRCIEKTEHIRASRQAKREREYTQGHKWLRRYWEHQIRDSNDFEKHVDYIHYNPVKHGYISRPIDWPFSTLHRCVQREILPANGANVITEATTGGER